MPPEVSVRRLLGRPGGGRLRGRASVLDAVIVKMGERALAGDGVAARELVRMARAEAKEARAEAREAALAEDAPPPVTVEFCFVRPTLVERAMIMLGAAAEGPPEVRHDGSEARGDPLLEPWIVDAALARDPDLAGRLTEWDWCQIRMALGEADAAQRMTLPPWPERLG